MTIQTQQQQTATKTHDEQILVVKTSTLFPEGAWQGLRTVNTQDYTAYSKLIQTHKEFHPRSLMEQDPTYKQIIPYLIFSFEDKYFLMERLAKASETRLQSKLSLGIGGHINMEDLVDGNIINWARREFEEEVNFSGSYTVEPLGILNDDSNAVGQVHVGFVYLLRGDSAEISVKSEHKSGHMLTHAECMKLYDRMESWSQIVMRTLK